MGRKRDIHIHLPESIFAWLIILGVTLGIAGLAIYFFFILYWGFGCIVGIIGAILILIAIFLHYFESKN